MATEEHLFLIWKSLLIVNLKCAVNEKCASCWVHEDCHVVDEQKAVLKKTASASGGKDESQVRLKGRERDYWMDTKMVMLRGFGFQGQVTVGDGSDKKDKTGAEYDNIRRKQESSFAKWDVRKRVPVRIGSVFTGACDTLIEEPLPVLYLFDNQALLKDVNMWIGEGGKATLVGVPDGADILAAAIEILRKRIAVGTATFLVKVKAHRGEPANEGTDILADKAISDPKVGKELCQRTNQAVFT